MSKRSSTAASIACFKSFGWKGAHGVVGTTVDSQRAASNGSTPAYNGREDIGGKRDRIVSKKNL